ncbi:MAG: diguanylate cyclase [Gammaproteobacteria bacterium]
MSTPPTTTRVLIVEDESIIALELAEALRDLGYEIVGVVASGVAAVKRARELRPDVVLMDIMLDGDTDGIAAAAAMQDDSDIPVIFCSAYSDPETLRRATGSGAHGFITKPYQANQVRALIETTITKARLERELRDAAHWFEATLRCCSDIVIATDDDGHVRFLNAAAEQLLGVAAAAARGQPIEQLLTLLDAAGNAPPVHPVRDALARRRALPTAYGTIALDAQGRRTPVEDGVAAILDDEGGLLGAVMVMRDVSERVRLERALDDSARRYRTAFVHAAAGVALLTLDGRIEEANPALHTLLARVPDSLPGEPFSSVLDPAERERERRLRQRLLDGAEDAAQREYRFVRQGGRPLWVLASTALLYDGAGKPCGFFVQVIDIDRRKKVEAELERLAHFDAVTGLVNRHGLQLELERSANVARRHGTRFAVLYIDLDHFKPVNDTLGHEAGDEVLVEVARRLLAVARTTDVVARPGGDEFVVLVNDLRRARDVVPVSDKIRNAVGAPVAVHGQTFDISASIGVSVFPDDTQVTSELMRHADQALYRAKEGGRDAIAYHDAGNVVEDAASAESPGRD